MALSDYRLKTNIRYEGESNGVNYYRWDWKPEFSDITSGMPTVGVIAQEVMVTRPDAVSLHESGYYAVDYARL